jgi:hypothetical protein
MFLFLYKFIAYFSILFLTFFLKSIFTLYYQQNLIEKLYITSKTYLQNNILYCLKVFFLHVGHILAICQNKKLNDIVMYFLS